MDVDAAGENAALKTQPPHHRVKAVGEPARDKVEDQAGAPVVVAVKVAEKAAAGSKKKTTITVVLGLRRGFRGGSNPGMGWRHDFSRGYGRYSPAAARPAYSMATAGEMDMRRADADCMQKSLDAINKRIEELESKPAESS